MELEHNVEIEVITPIWTGNKTGEMDRIRETGIIGSIRWWFEIIVRGLGYEVCDINSENKCSLKKGDNPKEKLCPVCYLFGTTGWKRRFSLYIDTDQYKKKIPYTVELNFIIEKDKEIYFPVIKAILFLMADLGGIGAKNQKGHGIFKLVTEEDMNNIDSIEVIRSYLKNFNKKAPKNISRNNSEYTLENYWKYEIEVNSLPEFNPPKNSIKSFLKGKFSKESLTTKEELILFGDRLNSGKLFVNLISKNKMKIWGFTKNIEIGNAVKNAFDLEKAPEKITYSFKKEGNK